MELILKETIASLGREGEVVKVKDGYGRNYLLPQGKAVIASAQNMANLERNRAIIAARLAKEQQLAEDLAKKINGLTLVVEQLAGNDNRLFGSVTSADICAKLAAQDIHIDKKHIALTDAIKALGTFKVQVKVGFNVTAEISVEVKSTKA
jgi:large subunit ribosomal protein L9